MSHAYRIALVSLCLLVLQPFVRGQSSKPPSIDPKTLIESLCNKSEAPDPNNYSFRNDLASQERTRIREILEHLEQNVEPLVPILRDGLDDKRYCITLTATDQKRANFTIGGVCHDILSSALSEPFCKRYSNGPQSKLMYNCIRLPWFARNRKELKIWLEERNEMSLLELQIEAGDRMVQDLKGQLHRESTNKEFSRYIKNLEEDIEALKTSQKPYVTKWWGLTRFP